MMIVQAKDLERLDNELGYAEFKTIQEYWYN